MTIKFRVTLLQQFLVLFPFLLTNSILIIFYYYHFSSKTIDWRISTVILFLFLLNFLPPVILHFQYLVKNWNATLIIETEDKSLNYFYNKVNYKYSFKDIDSLRYYATSGHISKKGSSLWYTFDPYRFFKITFKDHTEIVITCFHNECKQA
jgi:hypothetical protein